MGNNDHKNRKNLKISLVWSAGYSLLRAEGFFCNLDILMDRDIGEMLFLTFTKIFFYL